MAADLPTVARLSFRLEPDRMADFAAAYQNSAVPVLERLGLRGTLDSVRALPPDTFTRLFEIEPTFTIAKKQAQLNADASWSSLRDDWVSAFGLPTASPAWLLHAYSAPAEESEPEPVFIEQRNTRTAHRCLAQLRRRGWFRRGIGQRASTRR